MEKEKDNVVKRFFGNSMVRYIWNRIWHAFITMIFIITAVVCLLRLTPKENYIDPGVLAKIPIDQRETYKESIYALYGLDKPVHLALIDYITDILPIPKEYCTKTGFDETWNVICTETETKVIYMGQSAIYRRGKDVTELIKETFPVSFKISIIATIIAYLIGYPLGVLMARFKDRAIDKIGNGYIVLTMAVPALVFYYLWMIISMVYFKLPSNFSAENTMSWITPIWAIAFLSIASQALWVRRFMVDEINSDYVKFARSKGMSENNIMFKHVLRNAAVPLIRNIPAALIYAVVGSYFVESLWTIPGSGRLLIKALQTYDNPLVQGLTIVYALMSMAAFLLGDIITVFFDPRISLQKNK